MLIEHLRYRVPPEHTAAFAAHNRRWRAALEQHPGCLGQSTYRQEDDPTVWLVVVRWRDRAALEAFPSTVQATLNASGADLGQLERVEFFIDTEA